MFLIGCNLKAIQDKYIVTIKLHNDMKAHLTAFPLTLGDLKRSCHGPDILLSSIHIIVRILKTVQGKTTFTRSFKYG